jgi:hypothetical protein
LEQFPHLHCEKDRPTLFIKKTKSSPDLETPEPRFHWRGDFFKNQPHNWL